MEEASLNHKWLFTEEELQNTPSVRAGVSLEQEMTFRQKQAMLIQTIGLKSGLTQLAVNTSVIFMHRFFMYRTVKAFPRLHLALGFAFAGGKVEESARKLEHLIRTAVEVIKHNRNKEFLDKSDPLTYEMDLHWRPKFEQLFQNNCSIESAAYLEMRKLVLECETEIYGVIGFQLQIVHPHNYVIRMCALLGAENIKDISQYAYNLATASSQLTMLCLKYDPETIATMCLNIASKAHSVRFEPMKDSNVKWYQVIVPTTDFSEIEAVSEEFLHLIKGCPLLPSWMTNLARIMRTNNRAVPGPSRGPGSSSVSAPPGGRQSLPASSVSMPGAVTTSGSAPLQSSSIQSYPGRHLQPSVTSVSTAQGVDSRQPGRAPGSQTETVISPSSRVSSGEHSGSAAPPAPAETHPKHVSHSRPHPSGGSAQMRPPQPSSAVPSGTTQHHHHQQHRTHSTAGGQSTNQGPVPPGSGRPVSKPALPSGSSAVQGGRPHPQNPGQSGTHAPNHQSLPRPPHEQARHHDSVQAHDQAHSHHDTMKVPHDQARHRDHSRPHDPARSHEASRHSHGRPERRSNAGLDARHAPQSDSGVHRSQSSRPEHVSHQLPEPSTHTPPVSPPPVKSLSPPDTAADLSQPQHITSEAPDHSTPASSVSPDSAPKSLPNLDPLKQRSSASQGPKLSITMYRERASAKSRTQVEQTAQGDDGNASVNVGDESYALGPHPEAAIDSPVETSMRNNTSVSDLANFNKPQDSPSNPRIKIKVKRDPSSGERHAVKYGESGIKIKIKPLRSDASADGDAGHSSLNLSSRSSTPREEGEIIEDTPPSSGDSEHKSERLKIRLSLPRSDHGSGHNRRESDQGSNGYSGEREPSHRSHHHSHHHHHGKSKKHSKHDRSRHEGKSSSKRSASAVDHHDERPSKLSRSDTHSSSAGDGSHRFADHSEYLSVSSSRTLQQQNSGFSINDAFSSTLPHNIFDDDDDPGHIHPPITPTTDAVPPHHERFHQLMAQHRARLEATKKPPLPKGPPPPSPPPPPPTPPNL